MNQRKTRVGLVGAGFIGTVHAYAIQLLSDAGLVDARLEAVHDADPARAARIARHHGGSAVESLDDLLDSVDVVWCCPWTSAHLEVVTAVAERGLPVLCEKPLGRDLAEAEDVAAQLERVPHRVGLVLRCSPILERLEHELRSGDHGAVLAVVFRDDQYFPDHGMYRSSWRADRSIAGSGTLLEHSIHDIDLLIRLLGTPETVSARIAARTGRAVEDVAAVLLGFGDGTAAQLTSVWHDVTTRESTRRIEVLCERAMLTLDEDTIGTITLETDRGVERIACGPPEWVEQLSVPAEHAAALTSYLVQAKELLDDLAAGRPPGGPDAATARLAHCVVDASYRSARDGAPVELARSASR
jgi:myo-inositol 2-dehydrogenase/D-chiro-inositol 1-dehydrogenase